MQLVLVLDNIRSTYNVGAILRTAEGFGVEKVILSGYTPRINDKTMLPHLREKLEKEIHKTALGAEEMLNIVSSSNIKDEIKKLHEENWQVVGLENNITGVPLYELKDARNHLNNKIVLILGEEVKGINPELYELIDCFVEIPMKGEKESFNVSVATGIALYGLTI